MKPQTELQKEQIEKALKKAGLNDVRPVNKEKLAGAIAGAIAAVHDDASQGFDPKAGDGDVLAAVAEAVCNYKDVDCYTVVEALKKVGELSDPRQVSGNLDALDAAAGEAVTMVVGSNYLSDVASRAFGDRGKIPTPNAAAGTAYNKIKDGMDSVLGTNAVDINNGVDINAVKDKVMELLDGFADNAREFLSNPLPPTPIIKEAAASTVNRFDNAPVSQRLANAALRAAAEAVKPGM